VRKRFTYRGKYKPVNPEKYAGNVNNIVYRSSWERRFMVYCDNNEAITFWSSEELVIPYISPVDRKQHKYYPDFVIRIQEENKSRTIVIEVKPKKETKPPRKRTKITPRYLSEMKTWSINEAKWKYAKEFCEDRKWEFKILTEDQLAQ
jgi:hypothetical protein